MNLAAKRRADGSRIRGSRVLLVAAVVAASMQPLLVAAADAWQAYTFWGSPTVVGAKGLRKLVDDIEQASGGELKLKFNLGGTLSINAANVSSAVSDDIVQIADDGFNQGAIPIAGLAALPFLARNIDDMGKIMEIVWPLIERDYAKKGVTALGYYVYAPQVFWFRDTVTSLADIKGRKVRTTSAQQAAIVKSFGGIPVQLGAADVPAALQRGVVSAVVASAGPVVAWKDLLKSSYTLGLNYSPSYIITNSERFKKLSPGLQSKIRDLTRRATADMTVELQRDDGELTRKFASEGIVVTVAKPEELLQAEHLSKEIWQQWAQSYGAESVQTLDRVRKALGR